MKTVQITLLKAQSSWIERCHSMWVFMHKAIEAITTRSMPHADWGFLPLSTQMFHLHLSFLLLQKENQLSNKKQLGIYCKAGIEHRIEWKKPQMSSTTMALQIRARFWTLPKGYFTQIAELRNEGNQANIRSRKHGGKTHPPLYFRPPQPLTPPSPLKPQVQMGGPRSVTKKHKCNQELEIMASSDVKS